MEVFSTVHMHSDDVDIARARLVSPAEADLAISQKFPEASSSQLMSEAAGGFSANLPILR